MCEIKKNGRTRMSVEFRNTFPYTHSAAHRGGAHPSWPVMCLLVASQVTQGRTNKYREVPVDIQYKRLIRDQCCSVFSCDFIKT